MSCFSDCENDRATAMAAAEATRTAALANATTIQQIIDAENEYLKTVLGISRAAADCRTHCPSWAGGVIDDLSAIACDNDFAP